MLVLAKDVGRVMGLGVLPVAWSGLESKVVAGLPKQTLKHIFAQVFTKPGEAMEWVYKVIPPATYKRRTDFLSPAESERAERFARVIASAEKTFGHIDDARQFLVRSHPLLDGKSPMEAAMTEIGAIRVDELLMRATFGIPA